MTNYFGSKLSYRQRAAYKRRIRERDNYTCQLCGGYGDQVDHVIPWVDSHNNSPSNLRVLCRACNLTLRRPQYNANPFHSLDDWYAYLKRELEAEVVTGG